MDQMSHSKRGKMHTCLAVSAVLPVQLNVQPGFSEPGLIRARSANAMESSHRLQPTARTGANLCTAASPIPGPSRQPANDSRADSSLSTETWAMLIALPSLYLVPPDSPCSFLGSTGGYTNSFFLFDPPTRTWTGYIAVGITGTVAGTGKPSSRGYHGFTSANGKLYSFGGLISVGECAFCPAWFHSRGY